MLMEFGTLLRATMAVAQRISEHRLREVCNLGPYRPGLPWAAWKQAGANGEASDRELREVGIALANSLGESGVLGYYQCEESHAADRMFHAHVTIADGTSVCGSYDATRNEMLFAVRGA